MSGCFNCGGTDHWKDACPLGQQAGSFAEHMARIEAQVNRWADGEITLSAKRAAISAENLQWYGPSCDRRLLWP